MDYPLKFPIDEKVKEFLISSIERSYKIHEIDIVDDRISVTFDEKVHEQDFSQLIKKLLYIAKSINRDVLFENSRERLYAENPMQHLEKTGDVIKVADGMFLLQGTFWKLFRFFNDYWRNRGLEYGAIEQEYPVLWPIELYRKINYFVDFPQQVILSTTVKDNFAARDEFAKQYSKERDYETVEVNRLMAASRFGLQSSVCDTCYYALEGRTNFPNTVFTTYNKVFRNESSKIDSLDRLVNYSVRDIMFVGDRDFVLTLRQQMIDESIRFLEFLDLDSKIEAANDPFFTNDSAIKNVFQSTSSLKHEILAHLNFSGTYLSIGSINLHLDFFSRAFNIRLPEGTYAFSGCLGIGFERLVYALYCQYGHDIAAWPDSLREKLELT